jgi:hypothetical protein
MSRDRLDEATRALREESSGDDGGARFTRARVMASLHQGTVRRRTRLAFVLPLAATLAAASAWGVSSESGRATVRQVGERLGLLLPREPEVRASKPLRGAVRGPLPAPVPASPALSSSAAVPLAPVPVEPPAPPARSALASAAAMDAAEERELELYRAAHRSHFVDKNFGAAFALWSDYLRQVPGGRFGLEARYNRALCLVQLGRTSEARSALEPFARGAFGSYRQREAKDLLEALGD